MYLLIIVIITSMKIMIQTKQEQKKYNLNDT